MEVPVASVLVPFRNAESTLARALLGLRSSSALPLEILAVDDGSTDGGPALVSALAATDTRLRLVPSRGRGIVAALDTGLSLARAAVIVRMDADDECDEDRIRIQLDALARNPTYAAVGSRVEAFVDAGALGEGLARYVEWQNAILLPEDHEREVFIESPICHPSLAIRRDVLDAVGGYRAGPFAEDYDLFLRLVRAGARLAKVPETLVRWRHREGRLTFADPRYSAEAMIALKAEHLAAILRSESRPVYVWGAGRDGRRFARALAGNGVDIEAFVDIDPRKIGRTRRGRPIVEPSALPASSDAFVVVAVGSRGARALIRDFLVPRGFLEVRDFRCVA